MSKPEAEAEPIADNSQSVFPEGPSHGRIVKVDMQGMPMEKARGILEQASEKTGIPIFRGTVEYGYSTKNVARRDRCPRCGSATQEMYADFIYTTQLGARVMFAPAGHFCAQCPTVIVDEYLIKMGISDKRFRYQTVAGIDHGAEQPPDFFQTWNGQKPVYVFDEDGTLEEVVPSSDFARAANAGTSPSARKNANRKNREKMAKKSRKKNRRK